MTYIPVGTRLTYTAQVSQGSSLFSGLSNPNELIAQLKTDLPNLPGMEELDVEGSNSTSNFLGIGKYSISLSILNNGVDHGAEQDIQSIIDGTIQGYGNAIISSSITQIKLPYNPDDGTPQLINTGAQANAPLPTVPVDTSFNLGLGSLSGGSIAGISITIIIIALIALVLLLPGNARKLIGG